MGFLSIGQQLRVVFHHGDHIVAREVVEGGGTARCDGMSHHGRDVFGGDTCVTQVGGVGMAAA